MNNTGPPLFKELLAVRLSLTTPLGCVPQEFQMRYCVQVSFSTICLYPYLDRSFLDFFIFLFNIFVIIQYISGGYIFRRYIVYKFKIEKSPMSSFSIWIDMSFTNTSTKEISYSYSIHVLVLRD